MQDIGSKKIVLIIPSARFRDEEFLELRRVFEKAGAHISVASTSLDIAYGTYGLEIKPDVHIEEVSEKEYDGIIFGGGEGAMEYFNHPTAHRLAQRFSASGKLTSAICIAPATLAHAGLLNGKKATAYPTAEPILKSKGAVFTFDDVVCDGNIITAIGRWAATAFGQKIVDALYGNHQTREAVCCGQMTGSISGSPD